MIENAITQLTSLSDSYNLELSRKLRETEISLPQLRILSLLATFPTAVKQEILVAEIKVNKSTISRMVEQCETRGLVTRIVSPKSQREKLVSITDKGRDVLRSALETEKNLQETVLTALSAYEQKQFSIWLRALASRLEK